MFKYNFNSFTVFPTWLNHWQNNISFAQLLRCFFPCFMCFSSCFCVLFSLPSSSFIFLLFPPLPGTFEFQPLSYFGILLLVYWNYYYYFWFLFSSNLLTKLNKIKQKQKKTEDDVGSSPCEGRLQVSYDNEEEATRTFSIVHHFLLLYTFNE